MTLSVNFYKNFIQFKNMDYFTKQHSSYCDGLFKVDPLFKSGNKQKKVCDVCGAIAFIRMSGTSIIFEGHIPKAKLGIQDDTPHTKSAKIHCVGCGVWVDADTCEDNLCSSCRNTGPAMSTINYDDEYKDSPDIITWQQGQAREVSAGKIDDCDKEYNAKNHIIYSPPREQHRLLDVSNKDVDVLYKAHLADPDNIGKLRVYKNAESRNSAMYTRMMRAAEKKKRDVMNRELERDYKEREVDKAGGRKECIRKTLLPLVHVLENTEREEYKRSIAGLVYLLEDKKPVLAYEQRKHEKVEKPFALMVTGHRKLTNPDQVKKQLLEVVKKTKEDHPGLVMISGMALGTDTLFADIAVHECIPLHAYIPFPQQSSAWAPTQQQHHAELLKYAALTHTTDNKYSNAAYLRRNADMAKVANACVAVWNGNTRTGTANAVHAARGRGIEVKIIDPTTKAEETHTLQLFECAISQPPTDPNAEVIEVTRTRNHVLSPSWETLNQYRKDNDWEKYTASFKREMNTPKCTAAMKEIIAKARDHPVYLSCFEVTGNCHRHLLLKWMRAYCSA